MGNSGNSGQNSVEEAMSIIHEQELIILAAIDIIKTNQPFLPEGETGMDDGRLNQILGDEGEEGGSGDMGDH